MVKEAAKKSTHVRYVGWDVAMSINGPVLIEEINSLDMIYTKLQKKLDQMI